MNCHATRAVLDLHAEGRLTPPREAAVAAHLASCSACRGAGEAAPAPASRRPAPSALKAKLLAAAKAERPSSSPAPALALFPRDAAGVAWAAAALLLVALAVGWNGAPTQSFDAGDELAGRLP